MLCHFISGFWLFNPYFHNCPVSFLSSNCIATFMSLCMSCYVLVSILLSFLLHHHHVDLTPSSSPLSACFIFIFVLRHFIFILSCNIVISMYVLLHLSCYIFVSIIVLIRLCLHNCFVTCMSPCYVLLRPRLYLNQHLSSFPCMPCCHFIFIFCPVISSSCRSDCILIPSISLLHPHLHFCLAQFDLHFCPGT